MTLTDKQIEDFRLLHKKYFGVDISREEAYEKGLRFIQLMKIISKNPEKKK